MREEEVRRRQGGCMEKAGRRREEEKESLEKQDLHQRVKTTCPRTRIKHEDRND